MAKFDRKRMRMRSREAHEGGYNPACQGKKRYRDEEEAKFALRYIKANPRSARIPTRCYECHLCFGYHLTSQEESA